MDFWEHGITVIDPTPNLPLLCDNDEFINVAARTVNEDVTFRRNINHCRLFYNVSCISELFEGDGVSIQPKFMQHQTGKPSQIGYGPTALLQRDAN